MILTGRYVGASGQSPQEHLKAESQHVGMVVFRAVIMMHHFAAQPGPHWVMQMCQQVMADLLKQANITIQ